jgi:hypothetical protein
MTQNFEYPTTARRAFVSLAEAVRQLGTPKEVRMMLTALAGLHVDEPTRANLTLIFLEQQASSREDMARAMATLLDGAEKFDTARFMHHATSDSEVDDDSDAGKWSFNRTHQAEAQKTTIESVPDEGDGETVVL